MRDFFKIFLVGIVLIIAPQVFAESYKVLIIPDNIVTENIAIDSYIYNDSAEFFANGIATILNDTDYINSPNVSETRALYKSNPSTLISAKNLTSRFKTTYNVDYVTLKKLAVKSNARYVLLLTTAVDSENYILRRTVWDFLNVAGATVVDPAYKISTYAVLVDTKDNITLWTDTYQKTISVCENRIITRGPSPQTEQLQKVKDYSRYLCPQIAQDVQAKVLPPELLAKESKQIYYDIGNIDNVFTKKYRHLKKEYDKVYAVAKTETGEFIDETKDKTQKKYNNTKSKIQQKKADMQAKREEKRQTKLEVKATPIIETTNDTNNISNKINLKQNSTKDAVYKTNLQKTNSQNIKPINYIDDSILDSLDINRTRKNTLYGDYDSDRPNLRDYN